MLDSSTNLHLSPVETAGFQLQLQVVLRLSSESSDEALSGNHVARVVGLDPCMLVSSKDSLNVVIRD